ncbi:hypothetical protein [Sutcliffiella halmapala]|uniref:hypothetical protein n=1 Tax=Sutcliffiella halmapala TaxID=79882 RepID=UPI0009955BD0|nr:hypothetical protein [Sutcliffiella halmapala]
MLKKNTDWTWEQLEHFFYLSNNEKENVVFQCSLKELLSEIALHELLFIYGKGIQAENKEATAMYLAGWLGYLCGAMHFFSNVGKQVEAENITVQVYKKANNHLAISFYIKVEDIIDRKNDWIQAFYQLQITPIYQAFSRLTKNNLLHMWYQATHSFYWMKHRINHSILSREIVERYERELQIFIEKTSPNLFGLTLHPYRKKFIFVENPWDLNDPMPIKPSCCLAYQTEAGHCCFTCPRMKKEERSSIFQRVIATK